MSRGRPSLLVASRGGVGVLAVWLVLLGSVQAGMALPTQEVLASSVGVGGELDYGRAEGTVAPLTDAFVAQALGLPPPTAGGSLPVGGPASADPFGTGPASGADAADPGVEPGTRVVVTHPPDNDNFAQAYEVPSVPFTASTTASDASRQPGEPGSCAPAGPTLWYRYTADRTVGLTAHSVASGTSSAVGVFVGGEVGDLEPLGCDATASGPAVVRFLAEAGRTYRFQVSAPLGADRIQFGLDPLGTTTRMPNQSDRHFADASCGPVEVSPYPIPAGLPQNAALSDDGRFVVFASYYSETLPYICPEWGYLGSDEYLDVFVHDRVTGVTEMVSVSSEGEPGNERSGLLRASISADGRYVAFWSNASNLVPGDTNGTWDVFVRDRVAGKTSRVSVSSDGAQGQPPPLDPFWYEPHYRQCETFGGRDGPPVRDQCHWRRWVDLTPDGRYVVFGSDLVGLVDDGDAPRDRTAVYRHDRVTGKTIKVSLLEQSVAGAPTVSADGSVVAYLAYPEQFQPLPGGDDDLPLPGREDYPSPFPDRGVQVFVRDLGTGQTTLLTRGHDGNFGNGAMSGPEISADGRHVAFSSAASNLDPEDRNGISDVFVYDLDTGRIELASVNSAGEQQTDDEQATSPTGPTNPDHWVSISADGRYVAFHSSASNLESDAGRDSGTDTAAGNCPPGNDVFVRDRFAGTTLLVSVSSSGEPGNRCSGAPFISADGSTVVYLSTADNLVEDDVNGDWGGDLFFHDFWVQL